MLSNVHLKTNFNLYDYDSLENENIYTNQFTTDLSELVFLTEEHPFLYFFEGFTSLYKLDFKKFILHGYYHKETKSVNFFIRKPHDFGKFVYFAWKKFCKNDDVKINIYGDNCGTLYLSNEYETDKTIFYKECIKYLVNEL